MTSRPQTTDNLISCYDELERLVADLSDDEWATASLCPDWTVRGVVEHLASVEHLLVGWLPTDEDNAPPFAKAGEFLERAASLSNGELVAELGTILEARRNELRATTDEQFATASMTPVGPGTYHRFMDVRVFDFWVHQRDIAGPLGRSTDDGGPAAETTVDEVHQSMGYIAGKKIGLPDGMSLAIHLTGPVERDIFAAVDGRAAVVDSVDDPSVEVTTDSLTFVQLACGRIDPQGPIDSGAITWSGDADWGEKAARNLAFTM